MNRNWLLVNAAVGAVMYVMLENYAGSLVSGGFLVFWFTWGIGNVVNLLGVINANHVAEVEVQMKLQAQAVAAAQGVTTCDKDGEKKNPIGFLGW